MSSDYPTFIRGTRSMATTSITRLYGLGLTPGKLRGLQRISNPNGTLTMVATDQNSSMISMMKKATGKEPTYAEIADAKVMLSPGARPALLRAARRRLLRLRQHRRGVRGAGQHRVAHPRREVRRRQERGRRRRCGEVEPGWGVGKIKRCGADAVKLLAQFEPDELDSAERNFEFTMQIYDECIKHDILFLLEPLHFAIRPTASRRTKEQGRGPQGEDGDRNREVPEPLLRHLQVRVPRHARRRERRAADGQPEAAERRLREAVGAAVARASITTSTRSRWRWR